MLSQSKLLIVVLVSLFMVTACKTIPKDALKLSGESLDIRQMQVRKFDSSDEANMLMASAALLQDMGFTLEESETKLGVIVGSKRRDATSGAQVAGAVFVALLGGGAMPIDKEQTMRASLVTRPLDNGTQIAVRITFQRIVINTRDKVTTQEAIIEPEIYQEFFAKLSKSVFLEAHQI